MQNDIRRVESTPDLTLSRELKKNISRAEHPRLAASAESAPPLTSELDALLGRLSNPNSKRSAF